jgi:hypothetical protein
LSRVKSLEGLYLTAFNYQKVYTNKKVKEYYKENVYFENKEKKVATPTSE